MHDRLASAGEIGRATGALMPHPLLLATRRHSHRDAEEENECDDGDYRRGDKDKTQKHFEHDQCDQRSHERREERFLVGIGTCRYGDR